MFPEAIRFHNPLSATLCGADVLIFIGVTQPNLSGKSSKEENFAGPAVQCQIQVSKPSDIGNGGQRLDLRQLNEVAAP